MARDEPEPGWKQQTGPFDEQRGEVLPSGRRYFLRTSEEDRMPGDVSLDGRTLAGVENADVGEVSGETRFHFEQDGDRIYAHYSGGDVVDGHLVGTFDGNRWDVRYTQINSEHETATGHSVGTVEVLDDGRVRVEDTWEWESRDGDGASVLEEIE